MKSFQVTDFGAPLEPREVAQAEPTGTEVVVRVERCGVCHTDLHMCDGYYDLGGGRRLNLMDRNVVPPFTPGHEILGRVVATGPEADVSPEEMTGRYLVFPWLGCGTCPACLSGDENLCPKPAFLGVFRPGGYAETVTVPHPRYLIDIGDLDPSVAATFACSGLTVFAALKKVNMDKARETLLLIGAGGLGLMGIGVARALGFQSITVADIDPHKLEAARAAGADRVVDCRDGAAAQASLAADPDGIGAAIDFVGAEPTATLGTAAIRKGGRYVIIGLFGGQITLSLPLLPVRAISLIGSYVGRLDELRELINMARAGRIPSIPVETLPMTEVNTAIERLRSGKVIGRLVLVGKGVGQ